MAQHNQSRWRRLREQAHERAGDRCERCGRAAYLILHHLNYDRVGAERLADVELVCMRCHKTDHFAQPGLVPPRWGSFPQPLPGRRKRVAAIIRVIRAGTVCERCGDPERRIEWHHSAHPAHPERRIANLVARAPLATLLEDTLAEIDQCQAVCRRCHMAHDGRSDGLRHNEHCRGESNPRARLTVEQVAAIREAYDADPRRGRQTALAREYGIPLPTVNHIVHRRTWKPD